MNPVLALIITNIIWGAAPPIFKYALTNIPPFTLAFLRFFIASFLFLPAMLRHWKPISKKDFLRICLMAFFSIGLNIPFFFLGLKRTESINASVIGSAGPVFLYFLSILILKEKPRSKVISGMLLALLGVLVVILSPILLNGKKFAVGEIEGNIFFVISTFSLLVIDPLIGNQVLKRVRSSVVTYISFLIGSLMFLPLSLKELNTWSISSLNFAGLVGIVYGVFFSSAIAYYLYHYGMSRIKAQEVGLFNYLDPVVTVLIAIPLLGEHPDIYFFLGTVLVFGGIYIAEGRIPWHPIHKLKSQRSNTKRS